MSGVHGRKLGTVLKAVTLFYSRIILSKISLDCKLLFRKIERAFKTYIISILIIIIIIFLQVGP